MRADLFLSKIRESNKAVNSLLKKFLYKICINVIMNKCSKWDYESAIIQNWSCLRYIKIKLFVE